MQSLLHQKASFCKVLGGYEIFFCGSLRARPLKISSDRCSENKNLPANIYDAGTDAGTQIYQKIFISLLHFNITSANVALGFLQAKKKCPGTGPGLIMLTILLVLITSLFQGFARIFSLFSN
jgi:hypothetical protein